MTKILLLIILIIWPLGQLAILPQVGGLNLTALDLLTALLWVSLLFTRRKQVFSDRLLKPFLFFSLTLLISLIVSILRLSFNQVAAAGSYLLRFVSLTSVYFAVRHTKIDRRLPVISLAGFVILGLLQYLLLPDMRWLKDFGFDDHYFRLIGTLFDPNFTGLVLAQTTLLALVLLQRRNKLYSLIPLVALALTFSRASYLSFAVALLYLFIRSRGQHLNKYLPIYLGLLIALMWIIPKPFGEGVNLLRTFSITSRLNNQLSAVNLFTQMPIFGWGFNSLKNVGAIYQNRVGGFDNSFLYVLATSGLIGFAGFAYFLFAIYTEIKKRPVLIAVFIALLVHSLFNNSFFYLWESVFFYTCLGQANLNKKTPRSK